MPEVKKKKLRLGRLASELNISAESLTEHLINKGFKVKSINTVITDEMLKEIRSHFKKDFERAERHKQKLTEINKKLERTFFEKGKQVKAEKEETQPEPKKTPEPEVSKPPEKVEKKTEPEKKEEKPQKEIKKEKAEPTAEEKPAEIAAKKEEKEPRKEGEKFETETEKRLKQEKVGLKIVGKVDLGEQKKSRKKRKRKEEIKTEEKPVEKETKTITPAAKPEETTKKKKKKLKAKKRKKIEEEERKARKKKKLKKVEINEEEVDLAIKRTLLNMEESGLGSRSLLRKKKRKEKKEEQEKLEELKEIEKKKLKVTEFIAVNELANLMHLNVSEVIQKCIELGLMVSINQRLDFETISLVADEFGFEVEKEEEAAIDLLADEEDPEESLEPRPPVVTIMGHVDHGKTSLLDHIRKTNVVAGESGGITQHIGAYQVTLEDGRKITFLDTPGHEAFTAMRARGASITDIVVLVVAADDSVMPQTIEAINHSQAAGVPMIIAINKIDKPNANPEKIKQQLSERNILVEDWGGKYQCVELSAKTGKNVDELLEKILLEAEMLELKANPNRKARGSIIEARKEKGRGITATVLIQKGTLRIGDPFVAGIYHGRVRALFDERNNKLKKVPPSTPVLVLGFEGPPQAGDIFAVVESEHRAREISIKRQQIKREQEYRQVNLITLEQLAEQINKGGVKELPLVIKADVDGSVEAIADSLMKLSNEKASIKIIHRGVGAITEGDVLLASASKAIILGFHVRPNSAAKRLAEKEKVEIRLYVVIYDLVNEIKAALENMLEPIVSEELIGTLEVRETFKVPKVGTVAGCYVQDGKIYRSSKIRLYRNDVVIYEGQLSSLKRFKDDVKEVVAGYECGLNIANFNDIKVGDIIEAYQTVESKQKLN